MSDNPCVSNSCFNCEWWNIYSDDWGECKKKINGNWTKYEIETSDEYDEYGKQTIEHGIVGVNTDKRFYCAYWKKRIKPPTLYERLHN